MRTTSFTSRRIRNALITGLVALGLYGVTEVGRERYYDASFYLGYLLAGMILVLAAFNLRKKLTLFSLGTAAGWLQFHLYLGLLTPFVLALHTDWSWPAGRFEQVLTAIYGATFLSGVYGLYLTRTAPKLLTRLPIELLFEEYDQHFHEIKESAATEITESLSGTDRISPNNFRSILRYFARKRSFAYYLRPTTTKRRRLIRQLQSYHRYAAVTERQRLERLENLVATRDDYDFHHALQWKLRGWIFLHLSLTASLISLTVVHLLLVHLYRGSL